MAPQSDDAPVRPGGAQRGRASIREVADHAGVAMSSVSRVMSEHPDVSEAMRDRVWKSVEALGYTPNLLAQSMRSGRTYAVGFLAAGIDNPLLAEIAKGAEAGLREAGYSMLIADSRNDAEGDATALETFNRRRIDGFLLALASEDDARTVAALGETEAPFVLIDRELAAFPAASAVLSDHRHGMRDAVGHLLDLGHRSIGLISTEQNLRPSRERIAGLREAFAARGIADDGVTIVPGPYTVEHGAQATEKLLDAAAPPTAIIVGGNRMLVGLLRTLRDRRIVPGPQLSVVTCDETDLTGLLDPPIAAIARDNVEIGKRAGALLLGRLNGEPEGERVLLPTSFVPTASCAAPAT